MSVARETFSSFLSSFSSHILLTKQHYLCCITYGGNLMEVYFEDCKKIETYMDKDGNVFFNAEDLGHQITEELDEDVDCWSCIHKKYLIGGK